MTHEITPEEIRDARDVNEVLIASATNGLRSKKLLWYPGRGLFALVTGGGIVQAEMCGTVEAAIAYNAIDI